MGRGVHGRGHGHLRGQTLNIYHIAPRSAWLDATRRGAYAAASLDSEGFIHCSTAAQVLPVARNFYAGQTGLVLLVIDTRRLDSELKWETSVPPPGVEAGSPFPHVYGPVGLDAIVQAIDFEPNARGEFELPRLPAEDDAAAHA